MTRILHSSIICCLGLATAECTDQYSYKTSSVLENSTIYPVEIKFFEGGQVYEPTTIEIAGNSYKELLTDENDGKGKGETYLFSIGGFKFDSLVIEFDSGKRKVHYGVETNGANPEALNYNDLRNFFNDSNWQWLTLKDTRKRYEYEFKYMITQQDYLDAN